MHQLVLDYSFTLEEGADITLRAPGLNDVVYESELLGGPFLFL